MDINHGMVKFGSVSCPTLAHRHNALDPMGRSEGRELDTRQGLSMGMDERHEMVRKFGESEVLHTDVGMNKSRSCVEHRSVSSSGRLIRRAASGRRGQKL